MAAGKVSRRQEDYLEAVLGLENSNGVARVRDIAAGVCVNKSSVTAALKQLSSDGLVNYSPYRLVTLTARGRQLARRVRQRHDALSQFLQDVLGVAPEAAQANACRIEHVVDDHVLHRLQALSAWMTAEKGGLDGFKNYYRRAQA